MLKLLKNALKFIFKELDLLSLLSLKRSSALVDYGWFRSFQQGRPINQDGDPIPWYTYPIIRFLEKKDMNDFTIFEYGAGNSTLWWAARVSAIYVCEHDPEWYKIMENKVPAKVVLKQIDLTEAGKYCQEISQHKDKFNIIVVDGRDRNNCLRNCLPALTKDGVVILDNSERDSYKEGIDYLLQNGFRRIDFEGMGPVNPSAWSTSIFYKDGNCLGI